MSTPDQRLQMFGIAHALHLDLGDGVLDLAQIIRREQDIRMAVVAAPAYFGGPSA